MDLRLCAFEHQIVAPGLLILPVNHYSAFDASESDHIESLDWQPVIRERNTMRRKRLLAIRGALHGPQNLFKVPSYMPRIRSSRLGESHPLQNGQTGNDVP